MFPIIDISDWKVAGTCSPGYMEKIWIREPRTGSLWLLKYPSKKYPMDAAYEKICAEISKTLGLSHQDTEFAIDDAGAAACICRGFLQKGEHLVHGGRLIGGQLDVETSSPSYENHGLPFYTLQLILSVLDHSFYQTFLESVVFDSLVSNIDRHDKNWGVIVDGSIRLAPMYDYGLSFYQGKETDDTWFQSIAWEADDGTVIHNKLFYYLCAEYKNEIRGMMQKIASPDFIDALQALFLRVPPCILQDTSPLEAFVLQRRSKMIKIWELTGNV